MFVSECMEFESVRLNVEPFLSAIWGGVCKDIMNCGISIHIYCCTLPRESGPKKKKKKKRKKQKLHISSSLQVNPHYIMATEPARARLKNLLLSLRIKYIKGEISCRDWTHHNIVCRLNLCLEIICA